MLPPLEPRSENQRKQKKKKKKKKDKFFDLARELKEL